MLSKLHANASQLPPGPSGLKFVNAMKMGMGAFDYLWENFSKYGDLFTLQFPGMTPFVWMNRPDLVQKIFNLKPEQIDASKLPIPIDIGVRMTGFLNGAEHMLSRKIVVPPLIAGRLQARAGIMHEIISEHINHLQVGEEFNTPRKIGDITMDIAIYTLMGLRGGARAAAYKEVMLNWVGAATNNTMFTIGTLYGPYRWREYLNEKYLEEIAEGSTGTGKHRLLPWMKSVDYKVELGNMFREDIRRTRAENDSKRTDMFSVMCRATYEDGTLLDEERIISEAMGILVGGHETSAATSAWHMLWMLKRPDVYKKCREEVLACIQQHGGFNPLAICELPYCNAVLNESMRLTPSAVGTLRYLTCDLEVDGYTLPAGTNVLAGAYVIHRRKDIWGADAEEFRPERWLEEGRFKPGPFEFFPFGGGRRACVGSNHAKQQLRILWAEFYRRVSFSSRYSNNDVWPGQQQVSGQTEPTGGVPVRVTRILPANTGYPEIQTEAAAPKEVANA
ncbi:Cytochrome P450 hydroxylase [gamma proteobacterium HdN1]|nr:Cytochrome P450 hydroxylase [gamma proteobacterium HdN1]